MKDKKHIQKFNEHQENLNISDVMFSKNSINENDGFSKLKMHRLHELSEIFNSMIGKNVSLIDSTNYLLRVSGIMSIVGGKVELRKGNDRVSILVESITSFRELRSDEETKNFRFELHNGHSFDLVMHKVSKVYI
jgi:hypothetical protein